METVEKSTYKIFSSRNNDELCDAHFLFKHWISDELPAHGSVEVIVEYSNPLCPWSARSQHMALGESWEKDHGSRYYRMHIRDFILPHFLRREGIGLLIWSEINKKLPSQVRDVFKISGKLSASDAEIPMIDEKRRFVPDDKGERDRLLARVKMVNNVESRNRFWCKMLSHGPDNEPVSFECDTNGVGRFSGWLKDPLIDVENHRPRVVELS